MNHEEILNNRADLANDTPGSAEDCCDNELVFALRDKHHAFSLSLSTILQCLQWAEQEGGVPELPSSWWLQVREHYPFPRD